MDEHRRPVRLQLSRRKGYDLQAESLAVNGLPAVSVARPHRFGNPFRIGDTVTITERIMTPRSASEPDPDLSGRKYRIEEAVRTKRIETSADAVSILAAAIEWNDPIFPTKFDIIFELEGKNLACWCRPGEPCHADLLIDIANGPICEETTAWPAKKGGKS